MNNRTKHNPSKNFNWNLPFYGTAFALVIFLVSGCFSGISAQEDALADGAKGNLIFLEYAETLTPAITFKASNTKAVFNGDREFANINQFIAAHLEFPEEAIGTGIYGKVNVRFEILKNGEIGEITILESPGKVFDTAVSNLLAQMPAFIPAYENGESVNSIQQLQLNFRLQ